MNLAIAGRHCSPSICSEEVLGLLVGFVFAGNIVVII